MMQQPKELRGLPARSRCSAALKSGLKRANCRMPPKSLVSGVCKDLILKQSSFDTLYFMGHVSMTQLRA